MKSAAALAYEQSAAKSSRPKQGHSRKAEPDKNSDQDQTGKENIEVVGTKGKRKAGATMSRRTRAAAKKEYCICKQPDDGTPMVNCSECRDWLVCLI